LTVKEEKKMADTVKKTLYVLECAMQMNQEEFHCMKEALMDEECCGTCEIYYYPEAKQVVTDCLNTAIVYGDYHILS